MKGNTFILVAGYLIGSVLSAGMARAEVSEQAGQTVAGVSTPAHSKKVNFRIKPLETILGLTSASISFLVSPRLSLGVEGMLLTSDAFVKNSLKAQDPFLNVDAYDISASSLGGRADFAFGESIMASTWYASGSLHSVKVNVENNSRYGGEGSADLLLAKAVVGYQWMWNNFNINLAGGFGAPLVQKYKVKYKNEIYNKWLKEDDIKTVASSPALEFALGFAF